MELEDTAIFGELARPMQFDSMKLRPEDKHGDY
jgi:hypothetical protein